MIGVSVQAGYLVPAPREYQIMSLYGAAYLVMVLLSMSCVSHMIPMPVAQASTAAPSARRRKREEGHGNGTDGSQTAAEHSNLRKLTAMVAKLTLSCALQVRVIKSILLEVFLVKEDSPVAQAMMAATKKYSETADTVAKDLRVKSLGLPHHWAWNALMAECLKFTSNKQAYEEYSQYVAGCTASNPLAVYDLFHVEMKYARLQKCWAKDMKRLEVNCTPGTKTAALWEVMKTDLRNQKWASERRGMAPPGDLEEKIQTMFEKMGESNSQGGSSSGEQGGVAPRSAYERTVMTAQLSYTYSNRQLHLMRTWALLNVADLRALCRRRGVSPIGNKIQLINRLLHSMGIT